MLFERSNFRLIPALQCEREQKYLLSPKMLNNEPQNSPPKVTKPIHQQISFVRNKEREIHEGQPTNNPILVKEQYVQYNCTLAPTQYISNGCFACLAHGSMR